ncbi:MAG: hypothetical protein RL095_1464 [Verrucomicrobiota bacterium]|jgi:lipoprotein-releasing system permease protein
MRGELFLAWRYLKPKASVLSVITWLSLLGPVLGVGVLLVVTSVMNGFPREFQKKLIEFESHITVRNKDGNFDNPEPIMKHLNQRYGLIASPFTELPVFHTSERRNGEVLTFLAKGIDPVHDQKVSRLSHSIIDAVPGLPKNQYRLESKDVLVGVGLARKLHLRAGHTLVLHSPNRYASMMTEEGESKKISTQPAREFLVSGIFEFGLSEIDDNLVFLHIDSANDMLGMEWGAAQGMDLNVPQPEKALAFCENTLSADPVLNQYWCQFIPWQLKRKAFFDMVAKEKSMMSLCLFFIMGGAAIGVAACLFTLVLQKTREIGILKAVGVSPASILVIFSGQGCVIGVLGSLLGFVGGLTVLRFREQVVQFLGNWNQQFYFLKEVPCYVDPFDVGMILGGSIVICLFSSLLPALVAVAVDPVKALNAND